MTVVALFGQLGFQHRDAFAQQRHLVSQGGILLSELFQFFVFGHTSTLLACSLLCKPLVLLVSYLFCCTLGHLLSQLVTPANEQDRAQVRSLSQTLALSLLEKLRVCSLQRLALPMRKGRGSVIGALAKVQDHLIG